ncbi:MAG: MBL fold metallo-hydrolase [Oscillospiraceae bacterium]|nr:MBL fold metallo-hydrolase [Oscillospiraceae bacterium]
MNEPFYTSIAGSIDSGWFTVAAAEEDTFVISETRHWEHTHCYLLLGNTRALLIDTGLGVANIRQVIAQLTTLPILVATTHAHWDHIGGHSQFRHIAVHEAEQDWLSGKFPLPLSAVKKQLTCRPCVFPEDFHLEDYTIFQNFAGTLLRDHDCIDLGGRSLTVLHTPGHSPGHCCFYEPERKYLFSGDLIYSGCLYAFYPSTDPRQFYQSVQKIAPLDIRRIFPGHHTLDISPDIILQIRNAFQDLDTSGKLVHGSGTFDYGQFSIHL